jgi:hypothetical protein
MDTQSPNSSEQLFMLHGGWRTKFLRLKMKAAIELPTKAPEEEKESI